ncbi:unnamed protein product [Musa acuminata subsp. malaccensis]|uniref:(wild Malaysian banana) hypothetical protein n=1 Tax=Musa acuminata subsp. malaccensis TaxID=214687 RepID=A0A804KS08_MUSAM|nr:unnamed protein product [Musa acuminata subsp. malaccensis]
MAAFFWAEKGNNVVIFATAKRRRKRQKNKRKKGKKIRTTQRDCSQSSSSFAPWFLPFKLERFSTYILVFYLIVISFNSAAYHGLLVFVHIQRLFHFIFPSPSAGLSLAGALHWWLRFGSSDGTQLRYDWFYGCDDIKPCIRLSEYFLKKRDEGDIRERDELLCLPVYAISTDTFAFCNRGGRSPVMGSWLARGYLTHRSPFCLVGGSPKCVLPLVQSSFLYVAGRNLAVDI